MNKRELIEYLESMDSHGNPDVIIETPEGNLEIEDVGFRNLEPPIIAIIPKEQ